MHISISIFLLVTFSTSLNSSLNSSLFVRSDDSNKFTGFFVFLKNMPNLTDTRSCVLPGNTVELVENFDIQWKQNKIQWRSRTGMGNTPNLC